ncbi:hypothetical protein BX600DRAFT_554390 [Xylariales sp. PMI_506]|nr:hypothetical protein BX600DRAFT_554390 [Xylariales sp. PMI_506]
MDPNHHQPQLQPQAQYLPQPQQPYQAQYPVAPQPVAMAIPYSRAWHITKIVLYVFSLIFSVVVLGVSIGLVVDPAIESIQIIWIAPQACVAICWGVAELITICARSGHRGIHPGAHVALHLLLWIGYSASIGLTAYFLAFALECDYYCSYYDYYDYYSSNYLGSLQALVAFSALLVLIHFILFVRACVETSQRNRMTSAMVVMPPAMYYAAPPPAMGQYPVAQQPGVPGYPQQAHLSGYYGQVPKDLQSQVTGSTHVSQPSSSPVPDGLHPVPAGHHP